MGADQNLDWQRLAASALDWWRDAGVDVLVEDQARDWLAEPAAPVPLAKIQASAPVAAAPAVLPATIEAFLTWRIGEAAPETGWHGVQIAASGPATANLMVLVDCPEADDRECLLQGRAGKLFDRMLTAIGHSRADVHLAAVCCRRPIAGRMPRDTEAQLHEIARHHVALVAPRRLLALGNAASRAVGGTDVPSERGRLRPLNHKGGKATEVATSWHPRSLIDRPQLKADAWRDLQMLVEGLSQ